jgi:hypothetical protein
MSLYAIIKPDQNVLLQPAVEGLNIEEHTLREGEYAGIFSRVATLGGQRGAVVEMSTPHAGEARLLLDGIVSVNAGLVSADLIATAGAEDVEDGAIDGAASVSRMPGPRQPFPQPYRSMH